MSTRQVGLVSPVMATVLLAVTSAACTMAIVTGIRLFEFWTVVAVFLAGQVYAQATFKKK